MRCVTKSQFKLYLAGEHPILQLIKTNLEVYNRVVIFPPFLALTMINLFDN